MAASYLLAFLLVKAPPAAMAAERGGVVAIEAERATRRVGEWKEMPGKSGRALLITEGRWTDHLQYEIRFTLPGTYKLWLLGRSCGDGGADEVKVFFDEKPSAAGTYYEVRFPPEFGWTNRMLRRTSQNRKSPGVPTVEVKRPGIHRLFLVKGAEPECHAPPCERPFPNWQVDKIVLRLDDAGPDEPARSGGH